MSLRHRLWASAITCAVLAPCASAGHLQNEGFELSGGDSDSTTTFTGWNESGGGAYVRVAPTPLSGAASAHIVNNTAGGLLAQPVPYRVNKWSLDLDFTMPDPGGAGNRGLSLIIPDVTAGQINLRVVTGSQAGKGTVQVYSDQWNTIMTNAVNLSPSLDSPVVNHLRIDADWSSPTTSQRTFVVTVGSTATSPLSFYQGGTPSLIRQVEFHGEFSLGPYVVDNVSFIPEPAGIALLGLASTALLARRRRNVTLRR